MLKKSITLTPEGKKELENELAALIAERPAISERIATARAFGDLSENEDYSAARNEQKVAEGRILEIQNILRSAQLISAEPRDKVVIGAKVTVDMNGKNFTYSIVGPVEANPLEGKISNESPLGKALLGHKAGETAEFNGRSCKIISIE